jgi:poly(A) polymerase
MLWEPLREQTASLIANGMPPFDAFNRATESVLREQLKHVAIPKRFSVPMREIWTMQSRFERRAGQQAQRLFENKRFRAAYDFLLLRADVGEASMDLADWWTRFQQVGEQDRHTMVSAVAPASEGGGQKRRRRRRRRKPDANSPRMA